MRAAETIHASCVILDEAGILIRGPSGAGKSTLAREIVSAATQAGRFACHVADDRTRVAAHSGRLMAEPVSAISGKLEVRGVGLTAVAHESAAIVRLLLDLSSEPPPRLPEEKELAATLCGIVVPRRALRSGTPSTDLILAWARETLHTPVTL